MHMKMRMTVVKTMKRDGRGDDAYSHDDAEEGPEDERPK